MAQQFRFFFLVCSFVDMCLPNPCRHGGVCYHTAKGFLCRCAEGYTGDNCNKCNCSDARKRTAMNLIILTDNDGWECAASVVFSFLCVCFCKKACLFWRNTNNPSENIVNLKKLCTQSGILLRAFANTKRQPNSRLT